MDLVRIYMNINAYDILSIDATNPVFRVSDKIIPKPAFSATETRYNSVVALGASLNTILFNL